MDPTERMWTATKEKVAAKETIETDLVGASPNSGKLGMESFPDA